VESLRRWKVDNLKEVEDAKMDIKNERKEREGWQSEVEELKEQVEVLLKEKEEDKVAYEKMEAHVEIAKAEVSEWKVATEMAVTKAVAESSAKIAELAQSNFEMKEENPRLTAEVDSYQTKLERANEET
jgi:hypothetical protein